MSLDLRLLNRAQRETLDDTQLHAYLRRRCDEGATAAAKAVADEFADETSPHLEEVCRRLAERLRAIDDLRRKVQDELDTGGTALTTLDEVFEALALWVIENQMGGSLAWDFSREVRGKRRFRFFGKQEDDD